MNLERFIGWYGDKDIRSVQKKHVSEFLSELIERENYAKNTIDGAIEPLRESMGKLSYGEEIDSINEIIIY